MLARLTNLKYFLYNMIHVFPVLLTLFTKRARNLTYLMCKAEFLFAGLHLNWCKLDMV